jgi:predicted RNA-binding Zn-ribbon protein involved in translation (DUF1610 family)
MKTELRDTDCPRCGSEMYFEVSHENLDGILRPDYFPLPCPVCGYEEEEL